MISKFNKEDNSIYCSWESDFQACRSKKSAWNEVDKQTRIRTALFMDGIGFLRAQSKWKISLKWEIGFLLAFYKLLFIKNIKIGVLNVYCKSFKLELNLFQVFASVLKWLQMTLTKIRLFRSDCKQLYENRAFLMYLQVTLSEIESFKCHCKQNKRIQNF